MSSNNRHFINTASGLYTDRYQLAMGQSYFHNNGLQISACFDYFFRKLPFNGGYVIFSGLSELLSIIQDFCFDKQEIDWLRQQGFDAVFLGYLKDFRFRGNIHSVKEGEVVFPNEPLLRVEGNIIETQLIETLLLNHLNFQSLIATKAARMRYVAGERHLSEFGLRRSHAFGGLLASRAAVVGGFNSTSNVYAAKQYGLDAVGTMAHSFVQSFDDELSAFRAFAASHSGSCTLLVDTYDTLKSGVPNAIVVAKELEKNGHRLNAIRLDSGDLAYLSKKARKRLDNAGLDYVQIVVSNQLDEHLIKSLLDQKSPIDVFGVGTSLATGSPDSALDGVYKLSMADKQARIKLSENRSKTTLPSIKQIYRYVDEQGFFVADAIALQGEPVPDRMFHPCEKDKFKNLSSKNAEPLLAKVMENGQSLIGDISLKLSAHYAMERLFKLPEEHKRFDHPHVYKVGISETLMQLRDQLKAEHLKF